MPEIKYSTTPYNSQGNNHDTRNCNGCNAVSNGKQFHNDNQHLNLLNEAIQEALTA